MKINSVRAFTKRFYVFIFVGVSFMMISCDENNSCSNIKNGLYYKKSEYIDKIHIDKINKEDFENNYSKQYAELIEKIKVLYEKYGNDGGQEKNEKGQEGNNEDSESDDVEYNPPEDFIKRVRGIVEQNEKIYEETYKQIDKYTRKIPPMPWAFGCTIKGLVMYILHNPIIKCAVQYFDNYKYTQDETGETFDEMVIEPKGPIDEWHNCLVTFIRLLKLTYEQLESDNNVEVHGKLWNQIQGLEYLLHFLCFGYRSGWVGVGSTISFLQVFLNILGVFDFSEKPEVFRIDRKNLKHSAYCCYYNGFKNAILGENEQVGEEHLDSICCRDKCEFKKNILYIISKSNRANWMIHHIGGRHFFHFYLCKNAGNGIKKNNGEYYKPVVEEKVYNIHDGWYEYQDFINKILPKPGQTYCYYSIPFTYIISPVACAEHIRKIEIRDSSLFKKGDKMAYFWDSLIPLLSTNLSSVKEYSKNLYGNFKYSNDEEKKIILIEFLDSLFFYILYFAGAYEEYVESKEYCTEELDKNIIKKLLALVKKIPQGEENIDIIKIGEDFFKKEGEITRKYQGEEEFKGKGILKKALSDAINKLRWFLEKDEEVNFILSYKAVRGDYNGKVVFIERNIGQIPDGINEMFKEYVKKYFSSFGKYFAFENLVHGGNGANTMYDGNKYNQDDVLKVNWTTAGLKEKDLPIFRKKFEGCKFFKSAQFSDVVK